MVTTGHLTPRHFRRHGTLQLTKKWRSERTRRRRRDMRLEDYPQG